MKTKRYHQVEEIIGLLNSGRYFCECPCGCGHEINLKDAILFYNENFPPDAVETINAMEQDIGKARASLKSKRTFQAGKTRSVVFGQGVEKIIATMEDFASKGFQHTDCRSLFRPIDFLLFEGLSQTGKVSKIFFAEVKSGGATLGQREKNIRETVEEKG